MDLIKSGKLLRKLRKEKGMTQKEIAEKLGVVAKTVSKWETGHGFPDVSLLSALSEVLGVDEKSLLVGCLAENKRETGNIQRTKFYVCPYCGSNLQGTGNVSLICCGKPLQALQVKSLDEAHKPTVTEIENDFYIAFPHEMSKTHYIQFVSYIGFDRVLNIRLYPEQDCAVRIPKVYGGRIVYYCNQHGLFEYRFRPCRGK